MSKARAWPEMMTRDGQPIKLGMLLFSPGRVVVKGKVDDDYDDEDDKKRSLAEIETYRVIDVDLRQRQFRTRCHRGCEQLLLQGRGACERNGYYAFLDGALAVMNERVGGKLSSLRKEKADIEREIAAVMKLRAKAWPVPA